MILEHIDKIGAVLVQELTSNKTPESKSLEFKRALPGTSDGDKREFLKDVCAMANSVGGDIVYGVDEHDGSAVALAPITGEAGDAAKRRLGQLLDACVEPRLRGCRFHIVEIGTDGYVLVLRIPKSQIGPHRYSHQSQIRFPIRNETHVSDMSYEQLRAAFDRTATLSERARDFRAKPVKAIEDGRGGKNVAGGTAVVVHVMPLASMSGQEEVDILSAKKRYLELALSTFGSFGSTLNLDGLFVYQTTGREELYNYLQLYRSGAVEIYGSPFAMERGDQTFIPSQDLATFLHEAIGKALATPAKFGISGGAYLGISLLEVEGHVLGVGQTFNMRYKAIADRRHLILPERWVENIDDFRVDDVVKPLLDMLWQCFGIEQCLYYDDTGNWSPNRGFR